jgi:beta-galactosidase/beta-glucuronidase
MIVSKPSALTVPSESCPRPEYPRPQLVRTEWLNLNGEWEFEIDAGDSGLERGMNTRTLAGRITVPFAPESTASGIGNTDFLEAVWYRRTVTVPETWRGRDVLLHFGAVDYDTTVWVNGVEVARHRGGFTSFSANLRGTIEPGEDTVIVVRARDSRHGVQPRGKQSTWYASSQAWYPRTTGIWQTVWLEPVPRRHIERLKTIPDVGRSEIHSTVTLSGPQRGLKITARLLSAGEIIATDELAADADFTTQLRLAVPASRLRLWDTTDPFLYGLEVDLIDPCGTVLDTVVSYAGLRSVTIDGPAVLLNGEPVFQRLVLDQGYWPETLMTAPSDDALEQDILLGQQAGFNGARLHQKVFEERYFYHADRLGYLVWAEFGDWGCSGSGPMGDNQQPTTSYVTEWLEAVERDISHPSIVGWCPLNETYQVLSDRTTTLDDVTKAMFDATKAADPTRPVIDASGYSHRIDYTDIWDAHLYEQDPQTFADQLTGLAAGAPFANVRDTDAAPYSVPYAGQPYMISEYGGIWWDPETIDDASGANNAQSWGYGQRPATEDDWHKRYQALTDVLLDNPLMFGFCFTQLTDVYQEQNGIYRFDRSHKLDVDRIRLVQQRAAAIEHRVVWDTVDSADPAQVNGNREE